MIQEGLVVTEIESDTKNAISDIFAQKPCTLEGLIMKDINVFLIFLDNACCKFTSRVGNIAAHGLAKFALFSFDCMRITDICFIYIPIIILDDCYFEKKVHSVCNEKKEKKKNSLISSHNFL